MWNSALFLTFTYFNSSATLNFHHEFAMTFIHIDVLQILLLQVLAEGMTQHCGDMDINHHLYFSFQFCFLLLISLS